uniref:BTB domain-containing protein n=1 Tax=Latimeria chalumnae TaxID=7897 RepID=H3A7T3_LATCH
TCMVIIWGSESTIIKRLSYLSTSGDLSDMELIVNGCKSFEVHKLLLALQSDVFRAMLYSQHWEESQKKQISLTEDERCVPFFQTFLENFYTDQVSITMDNALPLHLLAAKYNVQDLQTRCEAFMMDKVAADGTNNHAITWHQYAKLAGLQKLEEECGQFIAWNLDVIVKSPDWMSMNPDDLLALLQRSDLVVESEYVLFQAVKNWVQVHPDHAKEMMKHIRFPMMSPEEIFALHYAGDDIKELHPELVSNCLLAYEAHCVPIETISRYHDITSSSFSPRLYTSNKFGTRWQTRNWSHMANRVLSTHFSVRTFNKSLTYEVHLHPHSGTMFQTGSSYKHKNQFSAIVTKEQILTCCLQNCHLLELTHSHKLAVLIYKFNGGNWFVREVKE